MGGEPIRPRLARRRARGDRALPRRRQSGHDRGLVAGLRRQGQGLGSVRRRQRPDYGRLPHRTSVRVGLLFPGEMGAAVGNASNAEVLWASEGRSRATAERAAGFTDVGSVAELVAASDVVLSICPPAIAEETAEQVFGLGFEGIYVEANAISPERMRRIAQLGPRIVDGSIIAPKGINLYLAG